MMRYAIFGNSGSGKTTLSRRLEREAAERGVTLAQLDLDTVAWESALPPTRRPLAAAGDDVRAFCRSHAAWIVEGCYADLIAVALEFRPELIFLNPGQEACLENCRARPWEPHKYATKAEQDARLTFLLEWVRDYSRRDDDCSYARHRAVFDAYAGAKREIRTL